MHARLISLLLIALIGNCCWAAEKPWLVYLHESPMASEPEQVATSLMTELSRQALLLAAREHFGALTRDAHCGEPLPKDLSAYAGVLEIRGRVYMATRSGFMLEFNATGAGKPPLVAQHSFQAFSNSGVVLGMITFAEQFSRDKAVSALELWGLPVRKQPAGPVVGADRIGEMCYFAQFQTLQHAHRALRAQPDGMDELSLLARTYANLGQLTRCHFDPSCKVFSARSLLYSARMVELYSNESLARATQAYTLAMSGIHAPAQMELANADSDLPWAEAVNLLCDYRRDELLQLAGKAASVRELATYMSFMTIENEHSPGLLMEAIRQPLQISPHCFRYLDAVCDVAGVSASHTLTQLGLPAILASLRDELPRLRETMPDSLRDACPLPDSGLDDVEFLANAGRALSNCEVPAEPSWSMLGNMVEQTGFLHVFRRANFMAFMWSVPTDEYLASVEPLFEGHAMAPLIRSMADEYRLNRRKRIEFCSKINVSVWYPMAYWVSVNTLGAEVDGNVIGQRLAMYAGGATDRVSYDVERGLYNVLNSAARNDPRNHEYAARMGEMVLEISPNNPSAAAAVVRRNPALAEAHMERWQANLAGSVQFQRALGEARLERKEFAAAAEALERAAALSPDVNTLQRLGDCYLALKQDDMFLGAMDRALKAEDYGLGHVDCRISLSDFYQSRGDHQKGIAAAEQAANSWAARAMIHCARYQELLGNWRRAELWNDRLADRYGDVIYSYFYCLRTGRGNRAQAAAAVRAKQQSGAGNGSTAEKLGYIQLHLGEKEYAQATALLRSEVPSPRNEGFVAMLLAVTPDPQISDDEKIAGLRGAAASQETIATSRPHMSRFAGEMANALQRSGALDLAQVEKLISEAPEVDVPSMQYFAGMYQLQHGQEKQGIELLKQAAESRYIVKMAVGLAAEELRGRNLIPKRQPRGFWQPAAATSPAAPVLDDPSGAPF